jgi:hypothetical protein
LTGIILMVVAGAIIYLRAPHRLRGLCRRAPAETGVTAQNSARHQCKSPAFGRAICKYQ